MIISRQRRKENIAEYILYMWQVEDLIRAFEFNREKIRKEIVEKFDAGPSLRTEIREWYYSLVDGMIQEKITVSGHLQFLTSLVDYLNDFHFRLVDSPFHSDYQEVYREAIYNIGDFRKRMNVSGRISDAEVCLTVLYGFMLMKMKKRSVSEDTGEAIDTIRKLVALLSAKFRDFEEGKLEI